MDTIVEAPLQGCLLVAATGGVVSPEVFQPRPCRQRQRNAIPCLCRRHRSTRAVGFLSRRSSPNLVEAACTGRGELAFWQNVRLNNIANAVGTKEWDVRHIQARTPHAGKQQTERQLLYHITASAGALAVACPSAFNLGRDVRVQYAPSCKQGGQQQVDLIGLDSVTNHIVA